MISPLLLVGDDLHVVHASGITVGEGSPVANPYLLQVDLGVALSAWSRGSKVTEAAGLVVGHLVLLYLKVVLGYGLGAEDAVIPVVSEEETALSFPTIAES